jgi:3-hydroxymyristoyl/3-hydroxydecanoyl-(acyl carrier protein) dehydratase
MTADPHIVRQTIAESTARISFVVPNDLEYFDGHFPGAPIVPGVVQLKWAIDSARRCFAVTSPVARLEVLKFQQVMGPGAEVTLGIEYSAEAGKVYFAFESDRGRYSSGRIFFSQASS